MVRTLVARAATPGTLEELRMLSQVEALVEEIAPLLLKGLQHVKDNELRAEVVAYRRNLIRLQYQLATISPVTGGSEIPGASKLRRRAVTEKRESASPEFAEPGSSGACPQPDNGFAAGHPKAFPAQISTPRALHFQSFTFHPNGYSRVIQLPTVPCKAVDPSWSNGRLALTSGARGGNMERGYLVASLALVITFAGVSRGFRSVEQMSFLRFLHRGSQASPQSSTEEIQA